MEEAEIGHGHAEEGFILEDEPLQVSSELLAMRLTGKKLHKERVEVMVLVQAALEGPLALTDLPVRDQVPHQLHMRLLQGPWPVEQQALVDQAALLPGPVAERGVVQQQPEGAAAAVPEGGRAAAQEEIAAAGGQLDLAPGVARSLCT